MTTIISWNVNGLRSNIVDFNSSKYKKPRNIDFFKLYLLNAKKFR